MKYSFALVLALFISLGSMTSASAATPRRDLSFLHHEVHRVHRVIHHIHHGVHRIIHKII